MPPGTMQDDDLRNDDTGFRAALYRDEGTGKLILVPRDTQPDSLVDWQANTRNGLGSTPRSTRPCASLTSTLAANDQVFDIAGYSKGGGLAQQGGLISELSASARLQLGGPPRRIAGADRPSDFDSLDRRAPGSSAPKATSSPS